MTTRKSSVNPGRWTTTTTTTTSTTTRVVNNRKLSLQNKRPAALRDQNRDPSVTYNQGSTAQVSGSQQPDLVKISSPRVKPQNVIAKLENVVDKKNRQLQDTKMVAAHNAKGFDTMAILVGYFANDALNVPQLK